ncbi:MAG: GNAT family N-acetyltransferase [Candidatus Heimdallarchaeota archaeon]|nr:MAG: GNAT family N-acetyltransferase [Candidatus Heimdallarchaeota archaeon]
MLYQPVEADEAKITTPDSALSHIKPGDRIFVGTGCAQPRLLILHLSNMETRTEDNEIYHVISFGSAPYVKEQYVKRFRYNSFFITDNIRNAVRTGRADYTPVSSRKLPELFRKQLLPIDVALIQTSMPDDSGYISLGISVDITKSAVENAKLVIAEINPEMPVTHGDSLIHVSDIDYMVENRAPIQEWIPPLTTPQIERVAKNVATLIEDGSTLHFGIGNVPNAVPKYLLNRENLGIHSEMITDSVLDLIEKRIVTNSEKVIHKGATISAFCLGTQRLYSAINDNPNFKFYTSDYVLDPTVVSKNPRMVTVNSALEIDLTGQVAADSLGHYLYSGIGGAVDLHRGALRSEGGKVIIALPSTSRDGRKSRIVSHLSPGAGVAITRADIEYVVSEYGIAYLHGATLRERVLAMIELAHPKFRKELLEKAKDYGYCYQDQIYNDPPDIMLYPLDCQEYFTLKHGPMVRIRPILTSDEDKLRTFFYSLSDQSRYSRYFSAIRALPHEKAQKEANIDFSRDMGIAAFLGPISSEQIIGTGHFYILYDNQTAEISLLVHEKYRNKGLARYFLEYLTKRALERGVTRFVTELIMGNRAAIHLLKSFAQSGLAKNASIERADEVTILNWEVPEFPDHIKQKTIRYLFE